MGRALGVVQTIGLTGLIEATDAMLKTALVDIREIHGMG